MKTILKTIILSSLLILGSCDLDLLDNPNRGKVETADVGLLVNSVELQFNSLLSSLSSSTRSYTRMEYQFGDYVSGTTAFNGAWNTYYAGILADIRIIEELGNNEDKKLYKQVGIAQIIEAYATVTMVDFFGNIPYSEAMQGEDNVNPVADSGESIYDRMYLLLDQAIENLENSDANETEFTDVYFNKDYSKWISLAKTLKFKMYLQTRKFNESESAEAILALLSEDLLDESDEDFEFRYGTNVSNPDTRSPQYRGNYNAAGVGNYMSNSYMAELLDNNDPRLYYYFFRQTTLTPEGANLVCDPDDPDPNILCYIGSHYWGRDHATTAGVPPDTDKRTTWGLYPAGGRFDDGGAGNADAGQGAGGAGINPILMASFVNFMKVEAALTVPGVTEDPVALYELAIRQSIKRVMDFENLSGVSIPSSLRPTESQINAFVASRLNEFNSATSTDDKLEVVMRQYWVALWGNGIESYNNYRRTGYPILQHPLSSGTVFPRVNLYPSDYTSTNSNASPQPITNQVFWDTNPAGFID